MWKYEKSKAAIALNANGGSRIPRSLVAPLRGAGGYIFFCLLDFSRCFHTFSLFSFISKDVHRSLWIPCIVCNLGLVCKAARNLVCITQPRFITPSPSLLLFVCVAIRRRTCDRFWGGGRCDPQTHSWSRDVEVAIRFEEQHWPFGSL